MKDPLLLKSPTGDAPEDDQELKQEVDELKALPLAITIADLPLYPQTI